MKSMVNGIGVVLWAVCAGMVWLMGPGSSPSRVDAALPPTDLPVWNQPYQVKGMRYLPMTLAQAREYRAVGEASWYGDETYRLPGGDTTASGEAFHPKVISAAHRTLPLPAVLRVTNLENGRSLVVRVNDRGPFPSDANSASGRRVVDLSASAAQALGFYNQGVALVEVETIETD